jgi:hypothetical protein
MPKWATIVFDMTLDTLKTMAMFFLIKIAIAASPIHIPGVTEIVQNA